MRTSLAGIALCALTALAIAGCDGSGDDDLAAARPAGECFDAATTLHIDPVTAGEAQQRAADLGIPWPAIPEGMQITSAVVEDDGQHQVIDVYLSDIDNWPSARVRISTVPPCSPVDRSALPVAEEVDDVPVYLEERDDLLNYYADFESDDAAVEASVTWHIDTAPDEDERVEFVQDWIEELLD